MQRYNNYFWRLSLWVVVGRCDKMGQLNLSGWGNHMPTEYSFHMSTEQGVQLSSEQGNQLSTEQGNQLSSAQGVQLGTESGVQYTLPSRAIHRIANNILHLNGDETLEVGSAEGYDFGAAAFSFSPFVALPEWPSYILLLYIYIQIVPRNRIVFWAVFRVLHFDNIQYSVSWVNK